MFYVIENKYVGPNQGSTGYTDLNEILICTAPIQGKGPVIAIIKGFAGSQGDWTTYAHGEFPSIEDARAAIKDIFGAVRCRDSNGDVFEVDPQDEKVLEIYKAGAYSQMSLSESANWSFELLRSDISHDTSDKRLDELLAEYEADANENGSTLHAGLLDAMKTYRDELETSEAND